MTTSTRTVKLALAVCSVGFATGHAATAQSLDLRGLKLEDGFAYSSGGAECHVRMSPEAALTPVPADTLERATVSWRPAEVRRGDYQETELRLSGEVLLPETEGVVFGVRVFVSKDPLPESAEIGQVREWAWVSALVRGTRAFDVRVPGRDIHRTVGLDRTHAVALEFARFDGLEGRWTGDAPGRQTDVFRAVVPGQEPLEPILQLVNAAPAPRGTDFDPAALIRAVNGLWGLGREGALFALEAYLDAGPDLGLERPPSDPASRDDVDPSRVIPIVLVLFEPDPSRSARGAAGPHDFGRPMVGSSRTYPHIAQGRRENQVGSRREHPRHPIALVEDIPFFLVESTSRSGWMADLRLDQDGKTIRASSEARAVLRWARLRGSLRAAPLAPGDPARALLEIASGSRDLHPYLRDQALACVRHLLPPERLGRFRSTSAFRLLLGRVRWGTDRFELVD